MKPLLTSLIRFGCFPDRVLSIRRLITATSASSSSSKRIARPAETSTQGTTLIEQQDIPSELASILSPLSDSDPFMIGVQQPSCPSSLDTGREEIVNSMSPMNYPGISSSPFPKEIAQALLARLDDKDIEIKSDGIIYLPEIKYRRILNFSFGPGGWGLMPRGNHSFDVKSRTLSREYALFCLGRFVSIARGEQEYFEGSQSLATVAEAIKSNALTRCCKDLGIASDLWDPIFISDWKKRHAVAVFCTNQKTKEKKRLWRRKDREFDYPWKED